MNRLPLSLPTVALSLLLSLGGIGLLSTVATAADTTPTSTLVTTLNKDDAEFVRISLLNDLYEIKASELAVKRGLTGAEATFAKLMIDDHSAVDSDLKMIAKGKQVAAPTALDAKLQGKLDDLGKKNDVDFPAAYLAGQVDAHKAAVSAFKEASEDAKDVDVKTFATKHLATLQAHLVQAKELSSKR